MVAIILLVYFFSKAHPTRVSQFVFAKNLLTLFAQNSSHRHNNFNTYSVKLCAKLLTCMLVMDAFEPAGFLSGGRGGHLPPLNLVCSPLELLNSSIPRYITTHCPPIVVQICICPPLMKNPEINIDLYVLYCVKLKDG